ncbi:hypothetical protein V2W45_1330071 [Cenococcum geophilum]
MDIIKANKCLRYWYGPPLSLKEALKAQVAAYKEAIEEAVKAAVEAAANIAANAVAEAPLGELGRLGKPVVIEPDNNETKSDDKGAYTVFKEAIKVEDYKASYIEAL